MSLEFTTFLIVFYLAFVQADQTMNYFPTQLENTRRTIVLIIVRLSSLLERRNYYEHNLLV